MTWLRLSRPASNCRSSQASGLNWLFISIAAVFIFSCDAVRKPLPSERVSNDPLWSQVVAERTAGLQSRWSKIHVRFVNDVIDPAQIGHDASDIIRVEPAIAGEARFTSVRDVVLTPSRPLTAGQTYHVVLHAKSLRDIPAPLQAYHFDFSVIKPAFEIEIAGISPEIGGIDTATLSGTIVTADQEEAAVVEKLLKAKQSAQALTLAWRHDPDRRRHAFTVTGIRRGSELSRVRVEWNGAPLGFDHHGMREIDVPARGSFVVVRAQAMQGERQHIELAFSEALDPSQNAAHLIQLSAPGFSTRVEGNHLRIYPNQPLAGEIQLTILAGLRSAAGATLSAPLQQTFIFGEIKPQVRFVGKGTILPGTEKLTIPIEAVNINSVQVTAFRIYENNMGQFLQTNGLDGDAELTRVGRYLWRKTISLSTPARGKWERYSLDVTDLLRSNPAGLFRLSMTIKRQASLYTCPSPTENGIGLTDPDTELTNLDDDILPESSSWDYAEDYYGENDDAGVWSERENPCKSAYYRWAPGVNVSRNFIGSNLGLLAKQDPRGGLLVVATNLATAQPMADVSVEVMNFQNQPLHHLITNSAGFANVHVNAAPFYLIARKDGQAGYLKINSGTSLPTSHFDVGGHKTERGLKGILYGERGVWRPGDTIHLTFVLQDQHEVIPDNHPVSLQLRNPKGQVVLSKTNADPVGAFYTFALKTDDDAPTGTWMAEAKLGGSVFSKALKIETVMPNRLKVELDLGGREVIDTASPLQGRLYAQWLNGATAKALKADLGVTLTPGKTEFTRAVGFQFDDRTREFRSDKQALFDGKLDDQGYASISTAIVTGSDAPGVLNANFSARVFEQGGAFSTNRVTVPLHPYRRYVGIKIPQGDAARGMLLTDTEHVVEIATLSNMGEPDKAQIDIALFKIDWKWWWDKSGESLAQYANSSHTQMLQHGTLVTVDGRGQWRFQVKYPDWGRYLLRACDVETKHCTSQVFYMDWPGWAGRGREERSVGANVLNVTADKTEYVVGDTAIVQLPPASQGRALVSIENGSRILDARWIEFGKDAPRIELPLTAQMSPTVYVNVTLLQPHGGRDNDRPLRLYGMTPLKVNDPSTRLRPRVDTAAQWKPQAEARVEISEAQGRAMTYTLAVVDEGLLGLTNFKTPDLHQYFYQKEALGVATWDLFDDVAGSYAGELERILALGGDADAGAQDEQAAKKRFPPVVKFLGPFTLRAGASETRGIALGEYVGQVRVMVVAGDQGAYGFAEQSVLVRDDLAVLPTLPRVLGAGEQITVPVTVFAFNPEIRDVDVRLEASDGKLSVDTAKTTLHFDAPGEQTGFLRLNTQPALGHTTIRLVATSGRYQSSHSTTIEVRSANPRLTKQVHAQIKPGERWQGGVKPFGMPGSDRTVLEMSAMPPLNLEHRLSYLIRYPHGCVEQITSAVFPQLYLSTLMTLSPEQAAGVQKHVDAGIGRLRQYQHASGGFAYWPGLTDRHDWATSYVTHFLVEAERSGYYVPPQMKADALTHLDAIAQSWLAGPGEAAVEQAYRLLVLALAQRPNIGAMNRLRDDTSLSSAARWQLAAAYALAGLRDVARDVVQGREFALESYQAAGRTFASALRDQAIYLFALTVLDENAQAQKQLEQVSRELNSDAWLDTHAVAYGLLAASRFAAGQPLTPAVRFEEKAGAGAATLRTASRAIYRADMELPAGEATLELMNLADTMLYLTLHQEGIPLAGDEPAAANGLALEINYATLSGDPVDVAQLSQSSDLIATVRVINQSPHDLTDLALTHVVPAGWEIDNPRLDAQDNPGTPASAAGTPRTALDYQDTRDDRVLSYFGIKRGEAKELKVVLNAAYLGRYYLPAVKVESMYNAQWHANTAGQWVEVVKAAP